MSGQEGARTSFASLAGKTVVVHTATYFVAGLLAFTLLRYGERFAVPPLSDYMRPITDPRVMAGPLMQPIRGLLFASVLFPLRGALFERPRGWLVLWWLLAGVGILSTFGPAPSSIEGVIYTQLSLRDHMFGLPETVAQTFMFAALLTFWVRHPEKRWVGWVLGVAFAITIALPVLGLLVGR